MTPSSKRKRRWYIENRERLVAKQQEYRKKNPDKVVNNNREYYERNKEELMERMKKYRRKNRLKLNAYQNERRQIKKANEVVQVKDAATVLISIRQ